MGDRNPFYSGITVFFCSSRVKQMTCPLVKLMLPIILASSWTNAHVFAQSEYQVKAAYLYNFLKFIEWPPEAFKSESAPFVVGIMGDNSFSETIEQTIKGKSIKGRQLEVKRLKWGQGLRICHILYVSSYEQRHLAQILQITKGASILTIGEMDQFTEQGGIINLTMEENKVYFEINLGAAEQSQIKISSKLLALAKNIKGGPRAKKQ
jgi:hypothetical protein